MEKADVAEAVLVCERVLNYALATIVMRGRSGADLRSAVGAFITYAPTLFRNDIAGLPLAEVFDKIELAGATLPQLAAIRKKTSEETPTTLGATLVKNSLIHLTYATGGHILANMLFSSREDVERIRKLFNDAFVVMEEIAADDMDQEVFQALIKLHAAIIFFLTETARPLPRMLKFKFAVAAMPTLVLAYRLYADAGRADELRRENKVVHPAFMRPFGQALSN